MEMLKGVLGGLIQHAAAVIQGVDPDLQASGGAACGT